MTYSGKDVKIKDAFKKNAGNGPLSAGTASAPTSGHGPTQIAHGGKGGAKGGGLSGGGLCPAAATAARPGIPFRCPSKARSFDPRTPMFRPLAIDGIGVTVPIDGDRKRR